MDALNRIMAKVKERQQNPSMTTTKSMEYKCPKCKDTGIVLEYREHLQPIGRPCTCRINERIEKAWSDFGVKPSQAKNISEFEPYDKVTENAKKKAINYIFNFDDKKENNWFVLMGQPGAGKSHLGIGMGVALFKEKHKKVIYMPYTEVIMLLKGNAKDFEKYTALLEKYKNAEVLVIDDLFKDKVRNGNVIADMTEVDMKHIYPLLNYRYYNDLTTIISTECTPEMLEQLDGALAGRIMERVDKNIVIFHGEEFNYRMKNFR
ncbi:ATP-binding protein [Clostridium perfringens]|uniref:ATP-binding protein n=1 Tax=Clostridium perfringens TaxID=1502 RepID=UPI0024BC4D15|nr:ATP-binding protein [Clostridium perfringens]